MVGVGRLLELGERAGHDLGIRNEFAEVDPS